MLCVLLVEPETPGNIGSVARVMKNFGVRQLLLVNPRCNHLDGEAYGRAMHARDILKSAVVVKSFSHLKEFDYVVATTAALGSDYNVLRSPITPGQLAQQLQSHISSSVNNKKNKIALVFGREGTGLTSREIGSCDLVVTIPASRKYRALNLSHAVAIVLYELFKPSKSVKLASHIPLASRHEKKLAESMVNEIISGMDFAINSKKETQALVWRRLISKSFLTKREMYALLGFLRKIIKIVKNE
ncbi:RNA methyltransferase [Candidatus Woesearchaeota archaeon]|nr:RNA methyltransferase [Candidatus Woesearchaeota archaeon]